jgi:prephenate dehydratase
MKIEFVQREDVDGTMWYFTQTNGITYVGGSGSYNKEKAYAFFQQFIERSNKKPVETVLETVEVDEIIVPF